MLSYIEDSAKSPYLDIEPGSLLCVDLTPPSKSTYASADELYHRLRQPQAASPRGDSLAHDDAGEMLEQ